MEPTSPGSYEPPASWKDDNYAEWCSSPTESSSLLYAPSTSTGFSSFGIHRFSKPTFMNIDDPTIYGLLQLFIPEPHYLEHLGFPVACRSEKTRAVVHNRRFDKDCSKLMRYNKNYDYMKICVRCGAPFDSRYPLKFTSYCNYHWGKITYSSTFMVSYKYFSVWINLILCSLFF